SGTGGAVALPPRSSAPRPLLLHRLRLRRAMRASPLCPPSTLSPPCPASAASRPPSTGCVFFFQAEDGIRYWSVTGVQTSALPIFAGVRRRVAGHAGRGAGRRVVANGDLGARLGGDVLDPVVVHQREARQGADPVRQLQIGRASGRERGGDGGGGGRVRKTKEEARE